MANKITYSRSPRATPKHVVHDMSKEAQKLGLKEPGGHHAPVKDSVPPRTPGQMSDELRSPPTIGFGRKPD